MRHDWVSPGARSHAPTTTLPFCVQKGAMCRTRHIARNRHLIVDLFNLTDFDFGLCWVQNLN
jgi:hypothetical protein